MERTSAPPTPILPVVSTQGLSFRRATPEDGETIAEIAFRVNVHSYAQFDRGFLFYSLSSEEYQARILAGHTGYIFLLGGEPIGFLLGITSALVRLIAAREEVIASPMLTLVERIANERRIERYFVADQAAIIPEYQDRGFGSQIFGQLMTQEPGPFFSDMLEAPLRNPRIRFWMKHGFVKVAEYAESPPEKYLASNSGESRFEQLTWGLYLLEGGWRERQV